MSWKSSWTSAVVWETPFILKVRLPLSGVNTTWNRSAWKLEFLMHEFNELDSNSLSALTTGRRASAATKSTESHDGIGDEFRERNIESLKDIASGSESAEVEVE
jgi:hypothetical protein